MQKWRLRIKRFFIVREGRNNFLSVFQELYYYIKISKSFIKGNEVSSYIDTLMHADTLAENEDCASRMIEYLFWMM